MLLARRSTAILAMRPTIIPGLQRFSILRCGSVGVIPGGVGLNGGELNGGNGDCAITGVGETVPLLFPLAVSATPQFPQKPCSGVYGLPQFPHIGCVEFV